GYLPKRFVSVNFLAGIRKATVNCAYFVNSYPLKSFYSTKPQRKIRIDRVFNKNRNIDSLQSLRNFLNGKGIGCRPGSYPENIYSMLKTLLDVRCIGYFGSHF